MSERDHGGTGNNERCGTARVRSAVVEGDLFEVDADVMVNPWNRNIIPWWLLLPGGVSGQLKRRAGVAPFRELARHGPMAVGEAVMTQGGRLGRPLIHVAGLNMRWRSTPSGVDECVHQAVELAWAHGVESLAMPVIGAGHGGLDEVVALSTMLDALAVYEASPSDAESQAMRVTIVRWARPKSRGAS